MQFYIVLSYVCTDGNPDVKATEMINSCLLRSYLDKFYVEESPHPLQSLEPGLASLQWFLNLTLTSPTSKNLQLLTTEKEALLLSLT